MKFNKTVVIIIVAVIASILAAIAAVNSVQATAIAYEEKVTDAKSNIQVAEKRRADLLRTLADAIKSYDKHEYNTLMDVINAREAQGSVITDSDMNEAKNIVKVVLEDYPQLSSQPNYEKFMKESSITENNIRDVRIAYNSYTRPSLRKFFLSLTGYERVEFEKLSYDVSEDAPTNLFD